MSNLTNVHTSIISKDDDDISGYGAQFSYPFLAFPHFLSKGLPPGGQVKKSFKVGLTRGLWQKAETDHDDFMGDVRSDLAVSMICNKLSGNMKFWTWKIEG